MRKAIIAVAASAGFLMAAYSLVRAQTPGPQAGAPQVIEISAKLYEFDPSEIRVKQGARVELKVHSEDETHGVKLDLLPEGADVKSGAGLLFDHPEDNG